MKKIICVTFFTLLVSALSSQTIINNPEYGFISTSEVDIDKIVLGDETTTIYFRSIGEPGQTLEVPVDVEIASTLDWQIDSVIETKGIVLGQPFILPESGERSWQAIYPAISDSTTHIDVGTFFGSGSWLVYDIKVREPDYGFTVPKEIKGNWMSPRNGDWELGIFDTLVIYDTQLWRISDVANVKRAGIIRIVSGDRTEELQFKYNKRGECSFALGNNTLKDYGKVSEWQYASFPPENKSFRPVTPQFDSVIIEGYIHRWNQRMGGSGFNVYVSNIFNSSQTHELAEINKDGYFSMKIPCYLPSYVSLRHLMLQRQVFIRPGESLFVLSIPTTGAICSLWGNQPGLTRS